MNTETGNETRSFIPFGVLFGGLSDNPAKAWEETTRGFYQGVMDSWNHAANPFSLPLSGMKGRPEDILQLFGVVWKESFSNLATIQDQVEALKKYARVQQDGGQAVYQAFADCIRKISSASQNGGLEKALRTCLEAHGGLLETVESSFLDQTKAWFDYWRSFIPPETRRSMTKKEKAS